MSPESKNPDITIRGGLINVPLPTKSIQGDRHQPDTPRTKKKTAVKSDHQPANPVEQPTKKRKSVKKATKPAEPIASE